MTVRELIDQLLCLAQDAEVIISDAETGEDLAGGTAQVPLSADDIEEDTEGGARQVIIYVETWRTR